MFQLTTHPRPSDHIHGKLPLVQGGPVLVKQHLQASGALLYSKTVNPTCRSGGRLSILSQGPDMKNLC